MDPISRQLQRETMAAEEARHRLITKTKNAEDRSYASSTVYGQKACRDLLLPVSDRITNQLGTLTSGKAGLDAVEVVKHLRDADPLSLALIMTKVVLDVLGRDHSPQLQSLTTAIGKAVQLDLRLGYYAKQEPELYKKTEFFFHKSAGTRQKATVFKRAFNKEGIEWELWSNTVNHKVGAWLLTCLMEVTGWIQRHTQTRGKRSVRVMKYSPEFISHRETILAAAEALAFCQWPMLCPPIDHTKDCAGGYLTESVRQSNPTIHRLSKVAPVKQGDLFLTMINNTQQQAFKTNQKVFVVADHHYNTNISVGKFRCDAPLPLPENLLTEDSSEEDIKAYKRARRDIENSNSMLAQKNWRTTEAMYVARKYVNEERWYCPAFACYRGRIHFLNTVLNPQGTDFDRSLVYFADEGPVNEPWLAWHLATCWGLDKKTHEERIQWTRLNSSLIAAIADDPYNNHQWRDADEPWCALAAIFEYEACCISYTKTTSGLPIGCDATNSGLQHLSCMTGSDEGKLVNVTPTDKPADGYRTVAERAQQYLPKELAEWIHRGTCKRPVMCCPYGVTESSARNYIRLSLKEDGREFDSPQLTEITRAIFRRAIPEIFPGAIEVMKWLKKSAKEILESGHEFIQWTTPSGFVVQQDLRLMQMVSVQTRLMGGIRVKAMVADGYLGPDMSHHKSALAPNVTHSMDSALLHLTFAHWDQPYTVIHDCVLGRSCDMTDMNREIRWHFAEMYKDPVLQRWANEVGVLIPDGLLKNTLDIEKVNDSQYFFC